MFSRQATGRSSRRMRTRPRHCLDSGTVDHTLVYRSLQIRKRVYLTCKLKLRFTGRKGQFKFRLGFLFHTINVMIKIVSLWTILGFIVLCLT